MKLATLVVALIGALMSGYTAWYVRTINYAAMTRVDYPPTLEGYYCGIHDCSSLLKTNATMACIYSPGSAYLVCESIKP